MPAQMSGATDNQIISLTVKDQGGKVLALFHSFPADGPYIFACLDSTDGKVLYSIKEQGAGIFQISNGFILMDSFDLITYVSRGESSGPFRFVQFMGSIAGPLTPINQIELSMTGDFGDVLTPDYRTILASGWLTDPNTGLDRGAFLVFDSSIDDLQIYGSTLNFQVKKIFLDLTKIHFCMTSADKQTIVFGIVDYITRISTSSVAFGAASDQTCIQAFGSGDVSTYYSSNSAGASQIQVIDYAINSYSVYELSTIGGISNSLLDAYILPTGVSFYIGSLTSLADSYFPQSYSSKNGFVFSFTPDSTCLTYSTLAASTGSIILDSTFVYELVPFYSTLVSLLNITLNYSDPTSLEVGVLQLINSTSASETFCKIDYSPHLFPPTLLDQTYQIGTSTSQISLPPFTFDLTCNDLVLIYSASVNNSASMPSFAQFNSSTQTLVVQSSDPNDLGVYEIEYAASINDDTQKSTKLLLTLITPCTANQSISIPVVSTTKKYNVRDTALTYTIPVFNLTEGICTQLQYSLLNYPSLTSIDNGILNFNPSTRVITIYSTDRSYLGTFQLQLKVQMQYNNVFVTKLITIQVLESCEFNQISVFPNGNWDRRYIPTYYDTGSGMLTYYLQASYQKFTQNQTNCPPIKMKWIDPVTMSPPTTLFKVDSYGALTMQASTADNGVYELYAVGYSGTSEAYFSNQIHLQDCIYTMTPVQLSQTYYYYVLGDPIIDIFLPGWDIQQQPEYGAYSYAQSGFSGLQILDYIGTNNPKFGIYSTNLTDVGVYHIQFQAYICSVVRNSNVYIDLTIVSPCGIAELDPPVISNSTYILRNLKLSLNLGVFTSNYSVNLCAGLTYELSYINNSSIDNSVFTFDPLTQILDISSSDPLKAIIYQLQYKAVLGTFKNETVSFSVEVQDSCQNAVLTPLPHQLLNYTIPSSFQVQWTAFSSLPSVCGTIIYTCSNSDGSIIDSGLFTFTPLTRQFAIHSTNNLLNGTYNLIMTGTLPSPYTNIEASSNITVYVNVSCSLTNISTGAAQNMAYTVGQNAQTQTFSPWTESVGECGSFIYSIQFANGSAAPSFIVFDQNSLRLEISTLLVSNVGTYNLQLLGQLPMKSNILTFTVSVIDPCPISIITPPTAIQTVIYQLNEQNVVNVGFFTASINSTICGPFNYIVTQNGGASTTPPFSFDPVTMNFNIFASSSAFVQTYSVVIKVFQGTYVLNYESSSFSVQVIDECPFALIDLPVLASSVYYLKNSSMSILIGQVSSNMSSLTCGSLTYIAKQNGLALTTPPFTFNSASDLLSLDVYSTNPAHATTYQIEIKVFHSLYPSNSYLKIYTVQIIDPCPTALILSPMTEKKFTYSILNETSIISVGPFTSSESDAKCGTFVYSMTQNGVGLTNPPFYFDLTTLTLSVYLAVGVADTTYNIKINGYQSIYPQNQVSYPFSIEIDDICRFAAITPASLSTVNYHLFYDSLLTFQFDPFTSNSSFCGSYTYSALYANGSQIDQSIVAFDPLLRMFRVNTTDLTKSGSNDIKVFGALPSPYPSSYFTFTLRIDCFNEQIIPPLASSFTYQIASDPLLAILPIFVQTPSCNYPFLYQLTYQNGSSISDFVIFYSNTLLMKVSTNDNIYQGQIKLMLKASLIGEPNANYNQQIITLNMIPNYYHQGVLPYFSPSLNQQVAFVGETLIYYLPSVVDLNSGCVPTIYASNLPTFISYNYENGIGAIKILASSSFQIGLYSLQIRLVESCPYQMINTLPLSIQVIAREEASTAVSSSSSSKQSSSSSSKTQIQSEDSQSLTNSSSSSTSDSYSLSKKQLKIQATTIKLNYSTALKAYIQSVSVEGVAKIKFTEAVQVIENFEALNSSYLDLIYLKNSESNNSLMGWKVKSFQNTYFEVQLNFSNPNAVSTDVIIISQCIFRVRTKQKSYLLPMVALGLLLRISIFHTSMLQLRIYQDRSLHVSFINNLNRVTWSRVKYQILPKLSFSSPLFDEFNTLVHPISFIKPTVGDDKRDADPHNVSCFRPPLSSQCSNRAPVVHFHCLVLVLRSFKYLRPRFSSQFEGQ